MLVTVTFVPVNWEDPMMCVREACPVRLLGDAGSSPLLVDVGVDDDEGDVEE